MKPLFHWPGSKEDVVEDIVDEFPVIFGTYYEPFCGSAATYFGLLQYKRICKSCVLNDINLDLINCYRAIDDDPDRLSKMVEHCVSRDSDTFEKSMAENVVNTPSVFFYLQLAKNHKRSGRYAQLRYDTDRIIKAAAYMRRTKTGLYNQHWETVLGWAKEGDVVYLDPPPATYGQYISGGFNESEHIWLNNYAKQLKAKKVHVVLTNSNSAFAERIYGKPKKFLNEQTALWVY